MQDDVTPDGATDGRTPYSPPEIECLGSVEAVTRTGNKMDPSDCSGPLDDHHRGTLFDDDHKGTRFE